MPRDASGCAPIEMMSPFPIADAFVRRERFQESQGLAEGSCTRTECASHSGGNTRRGVRIAAQSDDSGGHVDSYQHRRGQRPTKRSRIRTFRALRAQLDLGTGVPLDRRARHSGDHSKWIQLPLEPGHRSEKDAVRSAPSPRPHEIGYCGSEGSERSDPTLRSELLTSRIPFPWSLRQDARDHYSHSIVAGGFELTS